MRPIVVLGMHRSGTSAVTRALGLLGADMGPAEHMGEYWENRPLRRVNEDVLAAFGGGWECPPLLDDGWVGSSEASTILPRARLVFGEELGSARVAVWKDPRTCITLPFWRPVFDQEPVLVVVHRHPTEVARSLLTRDGIGPGQAFALWERYNADALVHAVGLPVVVVAYEALLDDPVGGMTTLTTTLAGWGVPLPNDPATTEMELTPERRHHEAASDDTFDHPTATASQRALFDLLREVEGASGRFSLPGPSPVPSALGVELLELAARLRASRAETRAVRSELSRALGSPRYLARRLLDRTVSQAWGHRPGRRGGGSRAAPADPPAPSARR